MLKLEYTARMKQRLAALLLTIALAVAVSGCDVESPSAPTDPPAPTAGEVSVHVLDVGEGLSVLIDDGDVEVLIDGGYARYGDAVSEYIREYIGGDIEYVIATHSHADHVGGLTRVYEDYQVDHTIYGDTGASGQYRDFENAANSEPDSTVKNDEDEIIALSDGVSLEIIDVTDEDSETNNNSVISILDVGGVRTLITGDAEAKVEKNLLGRIGDTDIFVVSHHGSETSSSQSFLDEIRPEYGIISSEGPHGKYHNPDEEVMKRLTAVGAKLYATYRSGAITVSIQDGAISILPRGIEPITMENYKDAA
jgi:beta-lactamase superfamily II metal-dependent hydrolase